MERDKIKNIIEALLFITDSPLSSDKIKHILDVKDADIPAIINELAQEHNNRNSGLQIQEVAGGFQLATRSEYGEWVRKLYKDRITYRMSKSALETLSIIAYKQPVTRAEIEDIRGVDATGVLENLLERRLIRICGRKEVLGRPMLYGTSPEFLKLFGLKDLSDIPDLEELASRAGITEEENEVIEEIPK